jgi:2-dehydro-3-deoxy-phosphogluconate aldolase
VKLFQHGLGGKVLLNIQTNSLQSSKEATELLGNAVLVGVTAKAYPNLEEGIAYIRELQQNGVLVSAGLGDGSAEQWERALELALNTNPVHLNQIFPAAGLSQYILKEKGFDTLVNGMIRPTGEPGQVVLGTGPLSQDKAGSMVSIGVALALMKEVGIQSVKFFPLEGTKRLDEVRAVARAVAEAGMMMEPTGGITPDNAAEIVHLCLNQGVEYLMPHIYGSLKDSGTGDLDLNLLNQTYQNIEAVLKG